MISLILAEKIFSLFLIMFMGYAVVHWGLLHAEDSKTLSLISLYLISPCVIISAFQVQYTPDVLHGLLLALAAAVLLHVGIIVVVNLLGHALHLDAVEKTSMIYSNAGNLIIPIVTAVLGKEWRRYLSVLGTLLEATAEQVRRELQHRLAIFEHVADARRRADDLRLPKSRESSAPCRSVARRAGSARSPSRRGSA